MQKVIGLDIGSYSIKAVEIVNTFKSYEIANFYENVIPEIAEVPLDTIVPACMEQLFRENRLEADRIITAMPGQWISSRVMPFNFSDARKIETAIMGEVEDVVPFNLDDMIVDHQVLGTMNAKTLALVVMTRKEFLRNFLDLLRRINIDPKLVDVDSLAFYNLSSFMDVAPGECFGLIDVGHEKTAVCIVRDGVLRMFRSINLGGRYLSEFLARDLEVSFNEAQRIKHRVSRLLCESDPGVDLTGDDRMVAERMTLAANAIVKELGRTLYAFKTWEKTPVSRLFLSGGTTRIKNFNSFLEEQLEVKTTDNRLDQTQLKINPQLSASMSVMPQSVAIGLRMVSSVKRHSRINLRRGEFAYVQDYESILRGAGVVFKVVAVALLLLCVSYGIKYVFYSRQIGALRTQYIAETKDVLTDKDMKISASASLIKIRSDAKSKLQAKIESTRSTVDTFAAENSGSGALIVLKAISEKLPKDLKVDVTTFQYNALDGGKGKLILRGETNNYESANAILEALKAIPTLSEVEDKGTHYKPGTDNAIVEFIINANHAVPGGTGKA